MLDTNQITELSHSIRATPEIPVFAVAIQIRGIPIDVVVNMVLVHMSADDKGMMPFHESFSKLLTDTICFFRCDTARLEGLTDLIRNHIAVLSPSRLLDIFSF